MSIARTLTTTVPDTTLPVFEALANVMSTAAAYAETAVRFSEIHDARGAAYAVRSASACLLTAAELMDELRPLVGRRA